MKREELRKLRQWQDRLETAKEAIQPELDRMGKRESIYDGDPTIYRPDGAKAEAAGPATCGTWPLSWWRRRWRVISPPPR